MQKRREDGRFQRGNLGSARKFITKTIFIAAGVGSFQPRTMKVDGIEEIRRLASCSTASRTRRIFEGKNLVICGGGDSALDWALNFVGKAESVVLLHRREDFRAAPASVAKMKAAVRRVRDAADRTGQVVGHR